MEEEIHKNKDKILTEGLTWGEAFNFIKTMRLPVVEGGLNPGGTLYQNQFEDAQGVEWICKKMDISKQRAIKVLQTFLDEGFIYNETGETQIKSNNTPFKMRDPETIVILHKISNPSGGIEVKDRGFTKSTMRCFDANEAVTWMVNNFNITREVAIERLQSLVDQRTILHSTKGFKEKFTDTKGNYWKFVDTSTSIQEKERVYLRDLSERLKDSLRIKDRVWFFKTYEKCFVANECVDWMVKNLPEINFSREEAVKIGIKLLNLGFIEHVVDDHQFKDTKLWFRFTI